MFTTSTQIFNSYFIQNCPNLETTQMSFFWMAKYSYNEILLHNKKEQNTDRCKKLDSY